MGAFAADHAAVYAGYNLFVKVSGGHAAGTVDDHSGDDQPTDGSLGRIADLYGVSLSRCRHARRPKAKSFENSLS